METGPKVTVFGPHPILTVTVEMRTGAASDDVHLHAGGQGVWVARMAAEMGATPTLCGFVGGEVGTALLGFLDELPIKREFVRTAAASGCYVVDRRLGHRQHIATAWSPPASRHEVDDLFSATCAAALDSEVLVVCNPLPGDALPAEFYRNLVADVRANGTPVLVDLSTPRLDAALAGRPDLVKLNDWELAQYVTGPVEEERDRRAAVDRLFQGGAASVVLTRGAEPAFAYRADGAVFEMTPPKFDGGSSEGCGDSMMGGIAASWAQGRDWMDGMVTGMATGAASYLRHGLGTATRPIVAELLDRVVVRQIGG